jgi:Delta3-Delta2-enoyl-CoA isomerase
MPTIALINGHAFAGALMTVMMHDYRFMNPRRGYLCLNELDFGAALMPPMASIFRSKIGRPDIYRTMVLESKRFNAPEALRGGIVDGLGSWEELSAFVAEAKLVGRAESGVYGRLKEEMYRDTIVLLDRGMSGEEREEEHAKAEASKERESRARRDVESFFSGQPGRTKL